MAFATARQSDALSPARPVALRTVGLLACGAALVVVALLSLRIGSINISTSDAWNALFDYDASSYNQTVVRSLRLPRTLIALAVGAGLGVAGAVMQAVTRNPLAGPSILGVSSGASFAIVTAIFVGGLTAPHEYVWFSFGGAMTASTLVFLIGTAMRPHAGVGQSQAHRTVSTGVIGHTLTFHEPCSAAEWLLLSHRSIHAGRGRCHGRATWSGPRGQALGFALA